MLKNRNELRDLIQYEQDELCRSRDFHWENSQQFKRQQNRFEYLSESYWEWIEMFEEKVYGKQLKLFTTAIVVALSSLFGTEVEAQTYEDVKKSQTIMLDQISKEFREQDNIGIESYYLWDFIIRDNNKEVADVVNYARNIELIKTFLWEWYVCEWWEDHKLIVNAFGWNAYADTKDIVCSKWQKITAKIESQCIRLYLDWEQFGYIVANKQVMKDVTWDDIDFYNK